MMWSSGGVPAITGVIFRGPKQSSNDEPGVSFEYNPCCELPVAIDHKARGSRCIDGADRMNRRQADDMLARLRGVLMRRCNIGRLSYRQRSYVIGSNHIPPIAK